MKMKKLLLTIVAVVVIVSCVFALAACNSTIVDDGEGIVIDTKVNIDANYDYVTDLTGKTLKVGAVTIGDETEGYSEAHISGINQAKATIEKAGGEVSVVFKKNTEEGTACQNAVNELAETNKCDLVITNSYGHQYYLGQNDSIVRTNPNTTFIAMTGDQAELTGLDNYKNAFTKVYQSRYVSGVVAGLKLKQLVDDELLSANNLDKDGNIKVGYVGAFPYAEVVSGYSAVYLGIKSIVSNVVMNVQYTNSWFDYDAEYQAAKALAADGCVMVGQHADSEGAPTACEEAYLKGTRVYSIGYNVDMLNAAPNAALTSATNNWAAYYTYAFFTAMTSENGGKDIVTNWSDGFDKGAVAITNINGKVFKEDPSLQVKAVIDALADGSLKVFDCSKFTVEGKTIDSFLFDTSILSFDTTPPTVVIAGEEFEVIKELGDIKYFEESDVRSAPYFSLRIDGISENTK